MRTGYFHTKKSQEGSKQMKYSLPRKAHLDLLPRHRRKREKRCLSFLFLKTAQPQLQLEWKIQLCQIHLNSQLKNQPDEETPLFHHKHPLIFRVALPSEVLDQILFQ